MAISENELQRLRDQLKAAQATITTLQAAVEDLTDRVETLEAAAV
jgi:hypothetical protein